MSGKQAITYWKRVDYENNNGSHDLAPLLTNYKFDLYVQPSISVIIPVYNEEKIIGKTLRYYTDELKYKYSFELIVSDGGSKDRTVEIAEKYADKVVKHNGKTRQNIAQGRNRGAEAASGDVLVFINGDTRPDDPETFFKMIKQWMDGFDADKSESAIACHVKSFPEETTFKDDIFYSLHNLYVQLLNSLGFGMGRGECQIIRTDIFKIVGGYDDNIVAGEDFDLYRRINKISKVKFSKQLKVLESPRRFRKQGYIKTIFLWTINAVWVILFGRSISKEWEAVR